MAILIITQRLCIHVNGRYKKTVFQFFDYVTKTQKSSEARFHLHPDFKFELTSRNHYSLRDYSNNSVMLVDILHGNARIEKTTWHPEFGVSIPNECLIVELINGKSNVFVLYSEYKLDAYIIPYR